MANIDVVHADEKTETDSKDSSPEPKENADHFGNLRTGDPDIQTDNGDIEADAKLEDSSDKDVSDESEPKESSEESQPKPETEDKPEEESKPEPAEEAKPEEEAKSEPEAPAEPAVSPEPTPQAFTPAPTPPAAAKVVKGSKSPKNLGRLVFEVVLVLLVIGLGYWGYGLSQDKKDLQDQVTKLNNSPTLVAQRESDATLKAVGLLVKLPADEAPTIANVSDAAKAKTQSTFFNNAENGDKVLFYVKSGQAILYRPSTNKIIAVGPLTINSTSSSTTTKATTTTTTTTKKP